MFKVLVICKPFLLFLSTMQPSRLPGYILTCVLILAVFLSVAQSDFYAVYKISRQKFNEGKYDEALGITLDALTKAEKTGNPTYIAFANRKVGNMYYFMKDKKTALKYYMTSMAIIEKEHLDSLKPEIYHNTSAMYNELHNVDSTLKYSDKAIRLYRENKNYVDLSMALSALTDIYISIRPDYKQAEKLINEAEYYGKLSGDDIMIAFAWIKRSGLLAKQKKYKEAIEQMDKAGVIYRKYKHVENMMYFYRMQSVYHFKLGDETALSYNDSLLRLKDSVFKTEAAKKSAEYATLYQTEKKERENKLLHQENIIKQTQIDARNRMIVGLVIGILLIGALVAWRISVMNLRKKEKELEASKAVQKEKERISRDLHDNVGGQLSYVLFSVDGLNDQDAEKRLSVTQNINESIRNVISNLRETIWAISDEAITVNDLSDKLKVYVRSMFRNKETKIVFNEQIRKDIRLNSSAGLNVYRICQEIINNAFKHSQASELAISITAEEQLEIEIRDNGVGFDTQNAGEGYGIDNMRKRAHETGIAFKMKSRAGEGTICKLVV